MTIRVCRREAVIVYVIQVMLPPIMVRLCRRSRRRVKLIRREAGGFLRWVGVWRSA